MGFKRRAFLKQIGWTLSALGISETGLWQWGDRYQQVLAEPTSRKLALLIGINQYPQSPALNGCLTDVDLQRELLIHRFGFKATDILTLTDQQATRQNIEVAFVSHLTEQAQPGDVVVLHFSGYGSQVGSKSDLQTSLVTADSTPALQIGDAVNDLPEETLLLLLRSLRTDRIATILDTSYTGLESPDSLLQGNLRVRSRSMAAIGHPSSATLAFQEQLLIQSKASKSQTRTERQSGQMPGVVLAAVGESSSGPRMGSTDKAFEGRWSGFSAGLFTYALTQQLWWTTNASTLQVSFSRVIGQLEQLAGQDDHAMLSGQKSKEKTVLPYYLPPQPVPNADGVITAIEEGGKVGRLWLAGLPPGVLEYYGMNSLFTLLSTEALDSAAPIQVQLLSRSGLLAKVRPCCGSETKLTIGQVAHETIRVLPRQVPLVVALDSSLERIERVDATSAFSGIAQIKAVAAGEQPADCLFGKIKLASNPIGTASPLATATPGTASGPMPMELGSSAPSTSSESGKVSSTYGLFTITRRLLPHTSESHGEAVKAAVQRLLPQLETLLAIKLLRLTVNEGSSRLGVKAVLEMISPQNQVLMQRATVRFAEAGLPTGPEISDSVETSIPIDLPIIPIGSRIRYRLYNLGDRPLYFVLLGLDSSGRAIALYSGQNAPSSAPSDIPISPKADVLPAHETIMIPRASSSFEWVIREPVGICETLLIFSPTPFTQTMAALTLDRQLLGTVQRISTPTKPLEIAQAIVQDLHQASLALSSATAIPPDMVTLNVEAWCTLNFTYQVG